MGQHPQETHILETIEIGCLIKHNGDGTLNQKMRVCVCVFGGILPILCWIFSGMGATDKSLFAISTKQSPAFFCYGLCKPLSSKIKNNHKFLVEC